MLLTRDQAGELLHRIFDKDNRGGGNPYDEISDVIKKSTMESLSIITETQAQELLQAIERNFIWVSEKGCTVTDARHFIENIIRKVGGIENWIGDHEVA